MLKIAICDDDKRMQELLIDYLGLIEKDCEEKFCISTFSSGEELLESLICIDFDIIILDILMGGIDGIETARKIRSIGNECRIIFISSYDKRWRELISMGASAFLDKPVEKEDLEKIIIPIIRGYKESTKFIFEYHQSREICFIPTRKIISVEGRKNYIILETSREKIEYKGTLKEAWKQLSTIDLFIMPSRSFILNIKYTEVQGRKLFIKGKEICSIGDSYYEDTMNRYLKFVESRSKE